MRLLSEVEILSTTTAPIGSLTADATTTAWSDYLLIVACSCGVVFVLCMTPEEADADLLRLASLN